MKKLIPISIICILLLNIFAPINVEAETLREYEQALEKYKNDLNETNNQINVSKQELERIRKRIETINNEIEEASNEIDRIEKEIEKNNKEIENKREQSKRLMEYYQISNGDNIYLEYAFGASDITDMIYRLSIVEQLTEYNDRIMKELKELIRQNEIKKKELEEKKVELNKLKEELNTEASKVQSTISNKQGLIPNIQDDINTYQRRVDYLRSIGCSPDDVIGVDCARESTVDGFVRPVVGSYWISSYHGWNGSSGHKGYDYAQGCGNVVRAVANGTVYYVGSTKDIYGAKMIMIVHNYNGRKLFSTYAHLSGYAVRENQEVYAGQTIGYVGTTGWSTGCHLHLEMSLDVGWDYNWPGNYWTYVQHIVDPYNYIPRG